jgi:hypothetical protein
VKTNDGVEFGLIDVMVHLESRSFYRAGVEGEESGE